MLSVYSSYIGDYIEIFYLKYKYAHIINTTIMSWGLLLNRHKGNIGDDRRLFNVRAVNSHDKKREEKKKSQEKNFFFLSFVLFIFLWWNSLPDKII